ncbi:MAG: cation transporter [Proteobacteria bacterium]|nr:cation transporter [Pseudomonadota bacterium]
MLWFTLALTGGFMLVEAIAGWLTGSLALVSDAAHMFTDSAALAVSLAAVRLGRLPADTKRTYGYQRFEILAAAFNAALLFLVAIFILYEAWQRFMEPAPIRTLGMLVVAVLGLAVNLVAARLLHAGSTSNLNMKSAYLEVLSDLVGSAGVIVAALVILYTGLTWVDPLVAVLIGLWVVPRTWVLFRASVNILLEGVPDGLDLSEVRASILAVPGVCGVHELHVWAVASREPSLSAHVVVENSADAQGALEGVSRVLGERFHIHHSTIQVESGGCPAAHSAGHPQHA